MPDVLHKLVLVTFVKWQFYPPMPLTTFDIVILEPQIVIIGSFGYASPISSETLIVSLSLTYSILFQNLPSATIVTLSSSKNPISERLTCTLSNGTSTEIDFSFCPPFFSCTDLFFVFRV